MRTRSIALAGVAAAMMAAGTVPAHAQVKAGPELRVNTYTTGTQRNPSLTIQSNGDFVITWMSNGQDGSGYSMNGQRYNRDGSAKGGEFQVNTTTTGSQRFGHVATNKKGQFVVVFRSPVGAYDGIFAQRFDAAGTKVGAEFQVSSGDTAYGRFYPNVAIDNRGNFVVVWSDGAGDGAGNYGVRAKRYDASGNLVGAEFSVNTTTGYYQGLAKVAFQPSGGFVVVWANQAGSAGDPDFEVDGQRFDANGAPVGGEFMVNTYSTGYQYFPGLGVAADGSFIVDWQSADTSREVRAQRFSATGAKVGVDFQVNTYTTGGQYSYQVGVDSQGNYVVAWDDPNRDGSSFAPLGWRISSTDTRRGAEFQANTYTTGYQGITQVASDEVGNFIVAWHSDQDPNGGGRGVYAQRFGGLFPSALAVDAGGNRVWEPGETVAVQPTWQNQNGASQTFAATLGPLTGPAGATYTITDGTGNYGTVANGATQQCTDCYSVMVDNPNPRPVQHWDATAVEKITPDTLGEQKGWALHIGNSFTDVPTTNPFYRFIETVFHNGITGGCGGSNYCPGDPTTRDQMAVFVLVSKEGAGFAPPACGTPQFTDVPANSPFCRFIEELVRRGVTGGCNTNPPQYCPGSPVTREQMSVFVLRTLDPALNPPACGTPVFNDMPASSPFCKWVEELVRRGVVTGCSTNPPLYCPTSPVTREQMAVFLSVTFGLTLYGV